MKDKIEELSLVELKALVYDLLGKRQQIDSSLKYIDQLIVEKSKTPMRLAKEQEVTPEEKVE